MTIDPWILSFSAFTVIATIWMGFRSARTSKTASDFFVAGRSVSVGWNASAISGEYLSAASFMGVAGMVMSSGYDALWYPVCYACGYLFLLLFIAGPLRRFGAYTIPDFAEGRFDSPLFRKIAVIFVLFIGFFYTMPQMKGAGTTLAYIFPGLPYWVGVVLVGAVITLNVALGGMKGITLVQAFQYWAKMFAISVPIFVLTAVYGHYGKQLEMQNAPRPANALLDLPTQPNYVLKNPGPYSTIINSLGEALQMYARVTSKEVLPKQPELLRRLDEELSGRLTAAGILPAVRISELTTNQISYRVPSGGNIYESDVAHELEIAFKAHGIGFLASGEKHLQAVAVNAFNNDASFTKRASLPNKAPSDSTWLSPFGPLTTKAAKAAGLSAEESKPYSLLYTYSLIIALVCGTAGLPHILVRFYTNPDGVAAKRTTMWVMILIGVFYVFPPVFGVMGRNLMPSLYEGTGAKGTDKVVLELPRILNSVGRDSVEPTSERSEASTASVSPTANHTDARSARADAVGKQGSTESRPTRQGGLPWGSILSGITCAGAFAAFMSTFSGLLVSMTGAMAHDVYGRMLRPKSTPEQRLRAFKIAAVLVGGVAILLGTQVEQLQINFMVGQAFAIAAASYFPLLFMSCWWRGMTMKGAAAGMLAGGICALGAVSLTNFSDLKWIDLASFWAAHPLARILCEQPAIWTVPLAIGLMVIVSKLTRHEVPEDIRMKMLVLHAPEQLGLKQEYIQEHAAH